jgi:hypothetical protein
LLRMLSSAANSKRSKRLTTGARLQSQGPLLTVEAGL